MHEWHLTPGDAYLTCGIGYGRSKLAAFDAAEWDANILAANAIQVTSFIPPHWKISGDKAALRQFTGAGAFLPMAYAYSVSDHCRVAASLVIGINRNRRHPSIIMEHAGMDITKNESLREAEIGVTDAFNTRKWEIDRLEKIAIDAHPKDQQHVCALVAVVFIVNAQKPRVENPNKLVG